MSSFISEPIFDQCIKQLDSSLSYEKKRLFVCEYCDLNQTDLDVIFKLGHCFPSDYSGHYSVVFILYGIILLLAVPGNIFVVITVASFKKLHAATYFFIANLAVGDLLMTVFCIPFSVLSIIVLQYWPIGEAICIAVNYLQAVSVFVSAYSLVAISIDRYLAIMYPLRPRLNEKDAKIIITAVWISALVTTSPVAIFSKLVTPEERVYQHLHLKVCKEDWPQLHMAMFYTASLMVLQFFLPLIVLIFTYCRIAVKVWGSSRERDELIFINKNTFCSTLKRQTSNSTIKKCASDHSPAKMIRMTLTVVLVYSLCWLPFNVLLVIREFWPAVNEWQYMHIFWYICHWLSMSHTCYNLIILCWMNSKFRSCFVSFLVTKMKCWCCKNVLQTNPSLYYRSSSSLRRGGDTSLITTPSLGSRKQNPLHQNSTGCTNPFPWQHATSDSRSLEQKNKFLRQISTNSENVEIFNIELRELKKK